MCSINDVLSGLERNVEGSEHGRMGGYNPTHLSKYCRVVSSSGWTYISIRSSGSCKEMDKAEWGGRLGVG